VKMKRGNCSTEPNRFGQSNNRKGIFHDEIAPGPSNCQGQFLL
jgi:hypothetical protein